MIEMAEKSFTPYSVILMHLYNYNEKIDESNEFDLPDHDISVEKERRPYSHHIEAYKPEEYFFTHFTEDEKYLPECIDEVLEEQLEVIDQSLMNLFDIINQERDRSGKLRKEDILDRNEVIM